MKNYIFFAFTVLLFNNAFAVDYFNATGNCNSQDTYEQYDNFAFYSVDSIPPNDPTSRYTHVIPWYCHVSPIYSIENNKKLYFPFNDISFNSNNYLLDNCDLKLVWQNVDTLNNNSEFLIEIQYNSNSIAIIYGTDYLSYQPENENLSETYAYNLSLDSTDNYFYQYNSTELQYDLVYNDGNSYLYEIKDTDRDNMIVGLKYYSPLENQLFLKAFIENN